MYNKKQFNKINDKKVLHKIKKQWVTISLTLLMMLGGGAVATQLPVSANVMHSTNQPVEAAQPTNSKPNEQTETKLTINAKAKQLHHQLVNNSAKQTMRLGSRHYRKYNQRYNKRYNNKRVLKNRSKRYKYNRKRSGHLRRGYKKVNRSKRRNRNRRNVRKNRVIYVSKWRYNKYNRQLKTYRYWMRHGSKRTRKSNARAYNRLRSQMKSMQISGRRAKKTVKRMPSHSNVTSLDTQESTPNNSDESKQSSDVTPANINTSDQTSDMSSAQISAYEQQAKQQTLSDINQERQQNGASPLTESPVLDKLAALRAQQIVKDFNHYNPQGQLYVTADAPEVGLPSDFECAENIAMNFGASGAEAANNANSDMMYHDQDQGNGHRDNILDPSSNYIGIGATYNNGYCYIAEDFTSDNVSAGSANQQSTSDTRQNVTSNPQPTITQHQSQSQNQSQQQTQSDGNQNIPSDNPVEDDKENVAGWEKYLASDQKEVNTDLKYGAPQNVLTGDEHTVQMDQKDLQLAKDQLVVDEFNAGAFIDESTYDTAVQQLQQDEDRLQRARQAWESRNN